MVEVGTMTAEEARILGKQASKTHSLTHSYVLTYLLTCILVELPCKASNVLGWLAAFFEQVHYMHTHAYACV